ncbi:acyltransferase domain-containing protein [Lacticaseibacillus mingshuiensis]|uniref:Acyltransferase domain-containing protein n=1 Tax=Lacticaseibacillus mingshuiensis TaxID=2799574 RepID=A0ABW4CKK4_9LACO|nr:acyltransferase domain-containing protein [Lacticaseibacillus mingshuiensis]
MITLQSLMSHIQTPKPIALAMTEMDARYAFEYDEPYWQGQLDALANWQTDQELATQLTPWDGRGEGFGGRYYALLKLAALAHNGYAHRGISMPIYDATMRFFTRILQSDAQTIDVAPYDLQWPIRQLTLREFRLGAFEYERTETAIQVHIPNDADLRTASRQASYRAARDFFTDYFPGDAAKSYECHSWLMAPGLAEVLPPESKIRQFQDDFEVIATDLSHEDVRKWVFGRTKAALIDWPEHTTLQRNLKTFLLKGGKLGVGVGRLRQTAIDR